MIDYEQISYIEQLLYKALDDLQYALDDCNFKEILNMSRKYKYENSISLDHYLTGHNKMMWRLYTYLINGIHTDDVKRMLYQEFHLEPIICTRLVDDVYVRQRRQMMPNKIYAAHMMKRAGITNKKIATVLEVSSSTVATYLKVNLTVKN